MTTQPETPSLQRIVEQAPDPIVFADLEGAIRVWNAAATRLFGHTREEALGQTLDLIIPERFREQHWTGFDRALADHATKYTGQALTTRSMHKDGATIYVEMTFAIVLDDAGESLGALAFCRDVTERFERERAQRAAARGEAPAS